MPSESMPSESILTESMPGPVSGGSAKESTKQSAKETLQSWLQLMGSPQSRVLQQLARNTEEVEEGDQCGDIQVRLSISTVLRDFTVSGVSPIGLYILLLERARRMYQ